MRREGGIGAVKPIGARQYPRCLERIRARHGRPIAVALSVVLAERGAQRGLSVGQRPEWAPWMETYESIHPIHTCLPGVHGTSHPSKFHMRILEHHVDYGPASSTEAGPRLVLEAHGNIYRMCYPPQCRGEPFKSDLARASQQLTEATAPFGLIHDFRCVAR